MGTNITGIGNANAIGFKSRVTGGIYFPPELKDALVGVWSAYGKSNDSTDRNIIKNKIKDRGGDFVISNAAFKLNSGFGKYEEDFTSWDRIDASTAEISNDGSKIKCINTILNVQYLFNSINKDIPSFKVKISNFTKGNIAYYYRKEDGTEAFLRIEPSPLDKVLELPKSYNTVEGGTGSRGGFYSSNINIGVTIEQIPSFEGAFVTDGINDLITSTKTVQEMGITDEVTVVSMIHQIDLNSTYTIATTNYIENSNSKEHVRSDVYNYGKTGIYGYSASLINNTKSDIKNILGDKADYYVKSNNSLQTIFDAKFSVVGRISELTEASQVAWYWTFIANRVLTTDEINQVIAYFNLDRTLKPDILCDVKKQGITNDNHAEFGDKLIDFSGNGRDIQLNNIAWKLDSGIGKYETDLSDTRIWARSKEITSSPFSFSYNGLSGWILFANTELTNSTDIPSFKIQIKGLLEGQKLIYRYYDSNGQSNVYSMGKDGEYTLPSDVRTAKTQTSNTSGFQVVKNEANIITITQIPSHAGALCLDGVNDFGQFVGDLGLKDYTVAADRAYQDENVNCVPFISSVGRTGGAPFLMEMVHPTSHVTYPYSFGTPTESVILNSSRQISYQSTYVYNRNSIARGNSVKTGDGLTIGSNEGVSQYSKLCLWSFLLFPYTLSEFLLERQLKKRKLGTLYPGMVEFRPIIKSNIDIKNIVYLDKDSNVVKVGDYISIGSDIKTSITVLDGYKISKVSSTAFNNITIEKSNTDFIYDVIFYGIKKSPQKINLVIEQDSDYVQWNPNIKANVSKYSVTANIRKTDGTILKLVNGQFYSTSITGNLVFDIVPPYKDSDEVTNVVINGKSYVPTKDSSGNFYRLEIPLVFPKEINITIQEYIRYEDIVQPYPVLLRFKDENNNEISWGDKIKLGSSITRIGSFNDCNLLKDIYTVSNAKLNGSPLPNTPHVVERQMVFTCTATWIFDDNEPKCILSPRLLRIPNSSYKILGYIPDISGHGNNGVIHNSAYAEGSGVNEDGSYQFDGVDDFVTIPTLSRGGKQVLMKVNWSTLNGFIYDQRPSSGDKTFGIYAQGDVIAYSQNNNGNTYIDGIINNNIIGSNLSKITHNIVATCDVDNSITPSIGKLSYSNNYFAQMSLYDFMLFDEISTDDKIKELNEYVGIEAKVELPPYYWDAYGKTNLDGDKATIQQRGVAVGDYDLTNNNLAYEGMSGYNGYPVVFGANKTWETSNAVDYIYGINSTIVHITNVKHAANGLLYSYVKRDGALVNIKEIPAFRVTIKGLEKNSKLIYKYLATENATKESIVYLGNGIHKLPKSFVPTDALLDLTTNSWIGFAITPMIEGELVFDCDITIEILPEYENGLVYDGITDYSKNANIPALDDFTAIIKREWLKKQGCPLIKGSKVYEGGNGNALLLEWDKAYNFVFYKRTDIMEGELPDNISFITPTNYNGNVITRGSEQDTNGICIAGDGNAGFANMVFYKLILYPKTIPLLQINFLKNLMERDEIIDLTNPIFIKNE